MIGIPMMLQPSFESSNPFTKHRLKFLKCDLFEEVQQGLEEGISKLRVAQSLLAMAEKPEIAGLKYGGCGSLARLILRMLIEVSAPF
jgi:hypothetical protein